jgi:hypothetical protein
MNVCVAVTVAMIWRSFTVEGLWALWDNINDVRAITTSI